MTYKVGDTVVYPRHGAARIEEISEREFKGEVRTYLTLSVLSADGLVIKVPVESVKSVGVRDVIDAKEVSRVFEILRTPIVEEKINWSRRYKLNVEKIASGDVHKIAEGSKVQIRNVRRDAIEDLKKMKKGGDLTEDDLKDGEKKVQDLTDKYIKMVDKISADKQKEIMAI